MAAVAAGACGPAARLVGGRRRGGGGAACGRPRARAGGGGGGGGAGGGAEWRRRRWRRSEHQHGGVELPAAPRTAERIATARRLRAPLHQRCRLVAGRTSSFGVPHSTPTRFGPQRSTDCSDAPAVRCSGAARRPSMRVSATWPASSSVTRSVTVAYELGSFASGSSGRHAVGAPRHRILRRDGCRACCSSGPGAPVSRSLGRLRLPHAETPAPNTIRRRQRRCDDGRCGSDHASGGHDSLLRNQHETLNEMAPARERGRREPAGDCRQKSAARRHSCAAIRS